jgi:hypothetical protein
MMRASRSDARSASDNAEVDRLRAEVDRLRADVERLTDHIDAARGRYVMVPAELWAIVGTWPAILTRARTASAGMLLTLKEMQDIDRGQRLMEAMA